MWYGILQVTLMDGFVPNFGDHFDILNFGSLEGEFDEVQPMERSMRFGISCWRVAFGSLSRKWPLAA